MSEQAQYDNGEWSRETVQGPGGMTSESGATGASVTSVRVRTAREQRGWSQSELARQMQAGGHPNFHQTTVSRIEKGERPVTIEECAALGDALSASPIYLAGWGINGYYERAYRDGLRDAKRAIEELG